MYFAFNVFLGNGLIVLIGHVEIGYHMIDFFFGLGASQKQGVKIGRIVIRQSILGTFVFTTHDKKNTTND
jgi:hypothetical protein